MSITIKEIIKNRLQADGTRRVMFRFTDHLGKVHESNVRKFAGDADLDLAIDEQATTTEAGLVHREHYRALRSDDILNAVQNPTYSTTKEIVKFLIREMMREKNPEMVFKLEPIIDYMRANYISAQLQTFLNLDAGQLLRMNQKINAILATKTDLQTADDLVEDFDR